MIKSVKARTPILALILFVFAVGSAIAQNKVVVIPMLGGDSAQWALVDENQDIIAQSGGISVSFTGTGVIYLNFGKQVAGRPIITTPQFYGGRGFITAVICGLDPSQIDLPCGGVANANGGDTVRIATYDTASSAVSHAFYIVIP